MPDLKHYEDKMQTTKKMLWPVIFGLALANLLGAELGRLLGIKGQALAISVWWPPAGISLAAILLFGFRCWPGIFLGIFCYNFLHLYLSGSSLANPLVTALAVSFGSLIQALLGGFIIRTLSSPGYFNTVKDIFIFLIFGGILTCMTASSIGAFALFVYGDVKETNLLKNWLTFWLGDSLGIYIFTPLLVVWTIYKPLVRISQYPWEAFFMIVSFFAISVSSFYYALPLAHLFIPLSLWVTYRFRLFGATLMIFASALVTIIPTAYGYGIFAHLTLPDNLLVLVSFLEMIIITSLVLAAVINEREEAWDVLQNYTKHLEEKIKAQNKKLQDAESGSQKTEDRSQKPTP